jgi:hypothetical protein
MRSVEPGIAAVLLGLAHDADHREGSDAEQHRDREEVLQEAEPVPPADERYVEVVDEQQTVGLEVDRREDEEAPHREEVRDAGDGPLQQPGLPEHFLELSGDPLAQMVFAIVLDARLLPGANQGRQPQHPLGGEHQH